MNWPGAGSGTQLQRKVPSEYTYAATSGKTWGYGIGNSEYVLRWMKLQLRPPSRHDALQILAQNLKDAPLLAKMGQSQDENRLLPIHLIKAPVEVVRDYMAEVADCVLESIKAERDESTLEMHPIDLVITHPAKHATEWPETAINLTVKAVTEAFAVAFDGLGGSRANLRNVFLATEPEACAQMTMHDAAKSKTSNLHVVCVKSTAPVPCPCLHVAANDAGLLKNDCFVIVDAGGGTVVSSSLASPACSSTGTLTGCSHRTSCRVKSNRRTPFVSKP